MIRLQCDRCKQLAGVAIELFGVERHEMQQAGPPFGDYKLPPEWMNISKKDLCPGCAAEVERLINTIPARSAR